MNHLSEEQLVLHYYGEAAEGAEQHLGSCAACRDEFRRLQLVLNTVNAADGPERGPDYGGAVWERLKLDARPGRNGWLRRLRGWSARPWVWGPALAALLVAAFLAGRYYPGQRPSTALASAKVRERILLVAVGDHLDRSETILAELTHALPEDGKVDISEQQRAAGDLLDANRLYRQTAQRSGDAGVASVLDDLERVLSEIANSPSEVSVQRLADLQQTIHDQGLLFKVRILGTQVRQRERVPAGQAGTHL